MAPIVVPWLTVRYGWQMSFLVSGAVGFVWVTLWGWFYQSPEQSRRIGPAELAHFHSDSPEPPAEKIPWRRLILYRHTWAFIVGIAFSSPIWWFYLDRLSDVIQWRPGVAR